MLDQADIILASVLMDDLIHQGIKQKENVLGGAGLYALAGAALFSKVPILVTGVGKDFSEKIGPWFDKNNLSKNGLRFEPHYTPRNNIDYRNANFRVERALFGEDHFKIFEPSAEDLKKVLNYARGIYIFRNLDRHFWERIEEFLKKYKFKILWEISSDCCKYEKQDELFKLLNFVNGFSLNLEEAKLIFNFSTEEDIIKALQELPVEVVFLRAGARGSYTITSQQTHFIPSLKTKLVDNTGAGNAYSGAALVGMAKGLPPKICGAMGTISASETIKQFGPPEVAKILLSSQPQKKLKQIVSSIK